MSTEDEHCECCGEPFDYDDGYEICYECGTRRRTCTCTVVGDVDVICRTCRENEQDDRAMDEIGDGR